MPPAALTQAKTYLPLCSAGGGGLELLAALAMVAPKAMPARIMDAVIPIALVFCFPVIKVTFYFAVGAMLLLGDLSCVQ
jgi:hypothetical protein